MYQRKSKNVQYSVTLKSFTEGQSDRRFKSLGAFCKDTNLPFMSVKNKLDLNKKRQKISMNGFVFYVFINKPNE